MTIDERLEKLVGRHEALTELHEALAQTVELLTIEVRSTAETAREVSRSILDLVMIVRSHELRLSNLRGSA